MSAMQNRFRGNCKVCGGEVQALAGYVKKEGGAWVTYCAPHSGIRADAKPIIRVTLRPNGEVMIKPESFLGGDLFTQYKTACGSARFIATEKAQGATLAETPAILERLRAMAVVVDVAPAVVSAIQAHAASIKASVYAADSRAEEIDARLRERGLFLFPFQRVGVQWLASRETALLADDMGCGKTVQTLIAAPAGAPIVVVSPAVAKGVWRREVAKWRPDLRVSVCKGRGSFRWPAIGEVVAVNYDILSDALPDGEVPAGVVLVADEAHTLKNKKTTRSKRFRLLANAARKAGGKVWLLTATPILNNPPELWNLFQTAGLEREAFGGWNAFVRLFNGQSNGYGMEWGDPSPEVVERLKRVALRRAKRDVLKDLPAKTYRSVEVDIDATTKKMLDKVVGEIDWDAADESAIKAGVSFETISKARAALAKAKTPAALEMIEDFEEQDEALVVFSSYLEPIRAIGSRPGWATITGETSAEERTRIEDRFQRGELKGVACTIKAGGVAITLTRASNALFLDEEWTPALNEQAEDRIYRIGQSRGVVITHLVADHPVDERLHELLTKKRRLITASVDAARDMTGTDRQVEVAEIDETLLEQLRLAAEEEARLADEARARAAELAATAVYVPPPVRASEVRRAGFSAQPKAAPEVAGPPPVRRMAQSEAETWAVRALQILAGNDPDMAREVNGVGFNKIDGRIGHDMAIACNTVGLTDRQWAYAVKLCTKYHRQVGRPPVSEKAA